MTATVSATVSDEQLAQVDAAVTAHGFPSRAELIRRALTIYIGRYMQPPPRTMP